MSNKFNKLMVGDQEYTFTDTEFYEAGQTYYQHQMVSHNGTLYKVVAESVNTEPGPDNPGYAHAAGPYFESCPEWIEAVVDADEKVLEGIKEDGTKYLAKPSNQDTIIQQQVKAIEEVTSLLNDTFSVTNNDEFLWALVDNSGHLLQGARADGSIYFPHNEMPYKESDIEYSYVILDAASNILFGIKRNGKIEIPTLIANSVSQASTSYDKTDFVNKLAVSKRLCGYTVSSEDSLKSVVFGDIFKTSFALNEARYPLEDDGKVYLSWQDDDSYDYYLMGNTSNKRGFFTTLYPILASVGMVGTEAVEGWRIGLMDDFEEPDGVDFDARFGTTRKLVGNVIKDLIHMKGWEAIGHTMCARFDSEYLIDSLDELNDLELTPSDDMTKSTNISAAYVQTEGKHYYLTSSGWKELGDHWLHPFLKDLSGNLIGYNPDFSYDFQIREYKSRIENALGIKLRGFQPPASTYCPKVTNAILDSGVSTVWNFYGRSPQVNDKTNIGIGYRHSAGVNESDPIGNGSVYTTIVNHAKADIAAGSKHISFYGHAYTYGWENKKTDQLVSNGGTYPDSWVTPVRHPKDFPGDYLSPHPNTGLTDWKDWHPCPGTQAYEVWSALKYLIEELGLIPSTASDAQEKIAPITRIGFWDKYGQIYSKSFDSTVQPFYTERIDGSVSCVMPNQ